MANKPQPRPEVKKSLRSPPKENPKLALAEAQRAAALHAARVAYAEIQAAEQQLRFMSEVSALVEAIKARHVRYREFLTECITLGHGKLEEALEELRGSDLRVKHAGGKLLDRDSEVTPWAPWPEIEQIAALAAQSRPGGAR